MKKIIFIFLIAAGSAFAECNIPELKKFEEKAKPTLKIQTAGSMDTIDVKRLMRKTIMVESDCRPDIKHPVARGITQIEAETFNKMHKDKTFRSILKEIENTFGVNLEKNWANDTYTNIVAAYALYHWKLHVVPRWWDKRHKFAQLDNNLNDKEWNLYKIYFNSIAGKTTLKRWNKYDV